MKRHTYAHMCVFSIKIKYVIDKRKCWYKWQRLELFEIETKLLSILLII